MIYERGKESQLDLDEGVYIWIRATDPIGDSIWCGDFAAKFPELFRLMNRDRTIAIAPRPEVGFSFFLFDESRHGIDEVGDLLVACAVFESRPLTRGAVPGANGPQESRPPNQ